MKILYAFQGTGNGHISRAIELLPYLKKRGEVHTLISGSNYNLKLPFEINYSFNGLSLFYGSRGNLNYFRMLKNNSIVHAMQDVANLPLSQYDIIINDFEPITSLACKIQNRKSIHFGHQASFTSDKVPRPEKKEFLGEFILKYYCTGTDNIGLHFKQYDKNIFSPIIKRSILHADPADKGHIVFYLPGYNIQYLKQLFRTMPDAQFHCFIPGISSSYKQDNISFFPLIKEYFDESLIHCHGIVTGAGFETPSEAIYLGKKLLIQPLKNHYEQECNSVALENMGIQKVLSDDVLKFRTQIYDWLKQEKCKINIEPNNIDYTLDNLFYLYGVMDHRPYYNLTSDYKIEVQ